MTDGTVRHRRQDAAQRRLRLAAAVLALAVLAALQISSQMPVWPVNPSIATVRVLVGLCFGVTAILLSVEPAQRSNGRLFALAALVWTIGRADAVFWGPVPLLSTLLSRTSDVVLAAILLRYPDVVWDRLERRFLGVAVAWTSATEALWILTYEPQVRGFPADVLWVRLWQGTGLHSYVDSAAVGGYVLLLIGFLLLLARRWQRMSGLDRAQLLPVLLAAACTAALILVQQVAVLLLDAPGLVDALAVVSNVTRLLLPGAFLAAALGRRLARARVADLVVTLGRPGAEAGLQESLGAVLHDPTLRVAYWVPERSTYVDRDGREVCLTAEPADRLVLPVADAAGEPLAVVLADPSLRRHLSIVEAATAAGRLALEIARLQAGLRAQLVEVEESRTRIVEAELAGRRRLERDLHDGAQQRLFATKVRLGAVRAAVADPEVLAALELTRAELAGAMQELRDLAAGIHPAVLTEGGLRPALESVADRMPVPVELAVPESRYRPEVESAMYFVICEALTNAGKHAGDCTVTVSVREDHHMLRAEVADTGPGGAQERPGRGLAGLGDRLSALGGSITVDSRAGAGTRVQAVVPCG